MSVTKTATAFTLANDNFTITPSGVIEVNSSNNGFFTGRYFSASDVVALCQKTGFNPWGSQYTVIALPSTATASTLEASKGKTYKEYSCDSEDQLRGLGTLTINADGSAAGGSDRLTASQVTQLFSASGLQMDQSRINLTAYSSNGKQIIVMKDLEKGQTSYTLAIQN